MIKTIFTMGEAATAVDYAKSKISNDIKTGKLSASRDDPSGPYRIDGSELARVYGSRFKPERLNNGSEIPAENPSANGGERSRTPENPLSQLEEVAFLKAKISMLEQLGASEREQLSARIEDMKATVADAQGQRDRAMTLLTEQIAVTKQLTDQRPRDGAMPMPAPAQEPRSAAVGDVKRGFLGLFGRR